MGWSLDGMHQSACMLGAWAPACLSPDPKPLVKHAHAQAMLFTGWSLDGVAQSAYALGTGTWASAWVKMGSQWLCMGLYAWSLFAHLALRGRSFA